ncbi:unnamed protein product [Rotaria sp. Silwood1]|nr:unnamed protein product [Rotaria sp. Silwood1]CAF3597310.1 unnamed protein product [Rotaria sp. Silwood1]CAF3679735.1 unnamed protein product [Rotaria sp. Silwood1]CAF4668265.1 unnamed protein product [Rotaria sp. Silwood1]CAF4842779.1 unnamed protein product [Rotaria sp. Silwood1]
MSTAIWYEKISDDEQNINYEQDQEPVYLCSANEINYHVEIHAQNGNFELSDDDNIHNESLNDASTEVHVQDESYEMISDDDLDDMSLPEIMKIHLSLKQHYSN